MDELLKNLYENNSQLKDKIIILLEEKAETVRVFESTKTELVFLKEMIQEYRSKIYDYENEIKRLKEVEQSYLQLQNDLYG